MCWIQHICRSTTFFALISTHTSAIVSTGMPFKYNIFKSVLHIMKYAAFTKTKGLEIQYVRNNFTVICVIIISKHPCTTLLLIWGGGGGGLL